MKPSPFATTGLAVVAICTFIWGAACGVTGPRTGSETNFLASCDAGCKSGLSCICGVCTRACTNTDECSSLASGAACTADLAQPPDLSCSTQQNAFCDGPCGSDDDCSALGPAFRCDSGFCRMNEDIAPVSCPSTILEIGDNERSVVVDGTTRRYLVRLPANFTGSTAVPLVLDFHTLLGSPAHEAANSGYRELAEQEGFIVAWPEGIDGAWNVGPCCTMSRDVDDVSFARAVVDQIQSEACVDQDRIYAVGVAMGGGMAYQLGCNAADLFAGIAPSSFDLLAEADQPCQPTEPLTVISFRGTDDMLVPYEGGSEPAPNLPGVTMNFLGAVGTFEKWASLNDCSGSPSEPDGSGCSTYSDCADNVEVTLCTEEGGSTGWGSAEIGWQTLSRSSKP